MTRPAALGLMIALCLGAGSVGADWKEAHKLGIEALEAGRWADAESFFRAALAERAAERVNRLLKTAYLPHYHLGIALAEQGDCRAAMTAFSRSQSQGQIQKSKQADNLEQRIDTCRAHLHQVDVASAEVALLLGKVSGVSQSLAAMGRTPELAPVWRRGEPSFSSRRQQADDQLVKARQEAKKGKEQANLERLNNSKTLANEALAELENALGAARARLAELKAAIAGALEGLQKAEEGARQTLRSIRYLEPYPQKLGARVVTVERALQAITERNAQTRPERLEELTVDLEATHRSLRRAARRPPRMLTRAAESLFNGEFEEAITLLADERLAADKRAAPHVCLLRAAAHYGQWVATGESYEALLDLAALDITECGDDAPPLEPGLSFFSPRFVEFHLSTRATLATSETPDGAPDGEVGGGLQPAVATDASEPDVVPVDSETTPETGPDAG